MVSRGVNTKDRNAFANTKSNSRQSHALKPTESKIKKTLVRQLGELKMLNEVKRLYAMGFALHWLGQSSKIPVKSGWTKGPRHTLDELTRTYKGGLNLGVRLGRASKLTTGGYLAVIDCDVKSTEQKHLSEMKAALLKLIASPASTPVVLSGRGNGSMHLYIQTKTPLAPKRVAQSSEKVLVYMPSVMPTKNETKVLSHEKLKSGMRLRTAWEISVMGEGQQVVLPPSIHPDSKKQYAWASPLISVEDIPVFDASVLGGTTTHSGASSFDTQLVEGAFTPIDVDLECSTLNSYILNLILNGDECDDRSAALFTASLAMVKEGFNDTEILSVLTDKNTFLGRAAFDHAKTRSRARAAKWVYSYTLKRAKSETLAEEQFKAEVVESTLDPIAASKQISELISESKDWRQNLDRTSEQSGAKLKGTLNNITQILKNDVAADIFRHDLFSGTNIYGASPPWNNARVGQEIRDIDITNIVHWLVSRFKIEVPDTKIHSAVFQIASVNAFHPIRDYLASLTWDGTPRINTWLKRYLGAVAPEPYLSDISRKILCAMIARVMEPGVKFDTVLILEGVQGIGKSTAVRVLAEPWYSDAHININDKDAVVAMRSIWVMELGELSGMRKADVDLLKEFVTRQVDRLRMPYGRLAENHPRQCIFIGTTNSEEYLKDATGNRRFWPVKVGHCDIKSLKRDRDQLLAEALTFYELGEPLYLENPAAIAASNEEQTARMFKDIWVEKIGDFLSKKHENFDPKNFTLAELFEECPELAHIRRGVAEQMRAANCLRILGWAKKRRRNLGEQKVFWSPQ